LNSANSLSRHILGVFGIFSLDLCMALKLSYAF
jgi:hypothetical protein